MNHAHLTAFIEGLGGPEAVLILLIVLLLFGGKKLPEFARGLGKSIREFKKAAAGAEEEFKRAIEEEPRAASPAPGVEPITPRAVTERNAGASHVAGVAAGSISAAAAPATGDHARGQQETP